MCMGRTRDLREGETGIASATHAHCVKTDRMEKFKEIDDSAGVTAARLKS